MSISEHNQSSQTLDHFNTIDKETRYKIAQKEEDDSKTLLTFYRDRINAFVKEREEWLQKLDQMLAAKEEWYYQSNQLQAKREEAGDLQRSISESKISLHNEREQKLKLKRENDQLKIKELENRKRIYELMVLNEPEKENAFYKDLRPEVKKHMKNDLSIQLNKKNPDREEDETWKKAFGVEKSRKEILKTIYLPNEQLNTIVLENESLRRRVEEENIANAEQIAALEEELRIREEENFKRHEVDHDRIHELETKNKGLEKLKSALAKEYFTTRLQINERKERLQNENEILKAKLDNLQHKLESHDHRVEVENKIAQEMLEKKAEEYAGKFRGTIKAKDEALFMVKDQYAHVQESYLKKMKMIEENLASLANKYQTLDQRRMIENEDFKNDTKDVERKLRLFERRYFHIDPTKTLAKERIVGFKGAEIFDEEDDREKTLQDEENGDVDSSLTSTINSMEFSLIKQQLADLENKLDKTRKKEPFKI